ncbi:unnamed protein product [Pedinophyceae sp. YPF-701]|nr:unnamed protein product [Pedinophyceae sp. YPF-701]
MASATGRQSGSLDVGASVDDFPAESESLLGRLHESASAAAAADEDAGGSQDSAGAVADDIGIMLHPVPLDPGLYLVATPIGNMEDITLRALKTLAAADIVLCEDTRTTRVLLGRYGIRAERLLSYHEHNRAQRGDQVLRELRAGRSVALVSDAGTPGVSDPGADLAASAAGAGVPVVPVPGACAAVSALVASGLPTDEFTFVGFLPKKAGQRASRLRDLRAYGGTLVFYVSPHNAAAVLEDAARELGEARRCCLARELTKKFEEHVRGSLGALAARIAADPERPRGELTLCIEGCSADEAERLRIAAAAAAGGVAPGGEEGGLEDLIRGGLAAGRGVSEVAKDVSKQTGVRKKQVYALALKLAQTEPHGTQ